MKRDTRAWWLMSKVLILVTFISLFVGISLAKAELRKPLRGPSMKAELTEEQYAVAKLYMAIESQERQLGIVSHDKALEDIEKFHDIIKLLLDLSQLGDCAKSIGKVKQYSSLINKLEENSSMMRASKGMKLFSADMQKLKAKVFLFLTFMQLASDNFPGLGFDSSLLEISSSLADNDLTKFIAGIDNSINNNNFVKLLLCVAVDFVDNVSFADADIATALKQVLMAGKLSTRVKNIGPSFYITKGISIANDLGSANALAMNDKLTMAKLISFEFLNYYYLTYGGDLTAFYTDLGISEFSTIDVAYDAFKNSKDPNSAGQVFKQQYDADYLLVIGLYDSAASNLIRKMILETGLAVRPSYMNFSSEVKLEYHKTSDINFCIEPMLYQDGYDLGSTIDVKSSNPDGSFTSPLGLTTSGLCGKYPYTASSIGPVTYRLNYKIMKGGTVKYDSYLAPKDFIRYVYVDAKDVRLNGLDVKRYVVLSGGHSDAIVQIVLSPKVVDSLTYVPDSSTTPLSSFLGSTPASFAIRAKYVQNSILNTPLEDYFPTDALETIIPVPVLDISSIITKNGLVGRYTLNYTLNHPYIYDSVPGSSTLTINYSDLTIDNAYTSPWMLILVKDKLAAKLEEAPRGSFLSAAGDNVRLIPMNKPAMPNFSGLSGPFTVFLENTATGEVQVSAFHPVPDDGSLEFTIPADGRYWLLGVRDDSQNTMLSDYGAHNVFGEMTTLTSSTVPPSNSTGTITLPRTGQYLCYSSGLTIIPCAGTGQDGEIQAGAAWPEPRFEDNSNGTVTDSLTGLMWTKDAGAHGGNSGCPSFSYIGYWFEALEYVKCLNDNGILGYSDWRMPNINELSSLLDTQSSSGYMDTFSLPPGHPFSNVSYSYYWSSSTYAGDKAQAWLVDIGGGVISYAAKAAYALLWPVRSGKVGAVNLPKTGQIECWSYWGTLIPCSGSGQDGELQTGVAWPVPRYTDNGNDTITDKLTELVWTKSGKTPGPEECGPLTAKHWFGVQDYMTCLNTNSYLGYNDWRLPNRIELQSLIDRSSYNPALAAENLFNNVQSVYWSSNQLGSGQLRFTENIFTGYQGFGYPYNNDNWYVWPVRGGKIDPSNRVLPPQVNFMSENLPDGSYQVGPATKAWRFKSGTKDISGLKAVQVAADSGLGISQTEINIGNVVANTEFLVYLPIDPVHETTSLKSSYWKLVDANAIPVTITNSKTGQFWLKIKTNRPPIFSQLQLDSMAGRTNEPTSLPVLVSDPDGDGLNYSVISGGGSVIDGTWYGKPAKLYQYIFTSPGVHPVVIQADDGHGEHIQQTIYAVITSDTSVKDFFADMKYASATNQQLEDQYKAIQYLALNGIAIGRPDPNDPNGRIFEPNKFANQAEALGMLMKAATLRSDLVLDAEMRLLSNLEKFDQTTGEYYNFSWATPYVLKAEALGLIDSAETFEPNKQATREWFASMTARLLKLDPPMDLIGDLATYSFADSADFSSIFIYDDARAASFFGFMGDLGSSQIFSPKDSMIRADVAVVVSKLLRQPTIDGISVNGLTDQVVFGKTMPTVLNGQSFTVTGLTNLIGHRMLGLGDGNIKEDDLFSPGEYVNVVIIRPGVASWLAGEKLAGLLAAAPITIPTNPPDINVTEERSLLVLLEATDSDGRNRVRNLYRISYGVIFPDRDGDGASDTLDLWPDNPLYACDVNGNGIPDNADALWGLTNRSGSEQIKISGQVMTLQNAVISGQYAQMMNDPTPPAVASATPVAGSQELPLTQAITITFSRELDLSTVTYGTVTLTNTTTSSAVAVTIAYNLGVLTFTPTAALSYDNDYQFRLTTGIKDLAGHPLANDYLLTFKTEPQNLPPTGTIFINGGAQYTNNPNVTLTISAADPNGVAEMCLSLSGTCTSWVAYSVNSGFFLNNGTGTRTVYVWFKDGKGLANDEPAASSTIILDTSIPTLTLSMLADGSVTTENVVNVTGVAKDALVGIGWVKVNGKQVEFNTQNGVFSYPLPLSAADTIITVAAEDLGGTMVSESRTIHRDPSAPILTIDTPTDYSVTNIALMTISGTVEAGATVSVSLNGAAPIAAQVTGTTYTAQVTLVSTITLNTIQVTATGLSGKSSSAKRSIRYISTRWILEVTDPPQDTLISAGSYLLKGRVANVVNAPMVITITRGTDTYTPTVTDGTFEQLVTLPTDGLHTFSVLGTDNLNNKTSVTRVFNKVDLEPPIITAFSMPGTYNALQVPLTFAASDNVDVTGWCQVFGVASVADSCVWSDSALASRTFNSQGTKTITGFVKDAAGNISAPATANVTISFPVTLSVTVNNASGAGGTVTSSPQGTDPNGVSCTTGVCNTTYPYNQVVNVLQTPNDVSVFGGWGGVCSGKGTCGATMTVAKDVTASFVLAPKAMIGSNEYTTLFAAYFAVLPGDTILLIDSELPDNGLDINEALAHGKNVSLKGGYKADYSGKSGLPTYLKGRLNISSGRLAVDGIKVRP